MKASAIAALVFVARLSWAASSVSYLLLPVGGTGPFINSDSAIAWAAGQVMYCCRVPIPVGITATKIAFRLNGLMAAGGKCGVAVYDDTGAQLITTGGLACDAGNTTKTVGGQPAAILTAGTTYRACGCASTNSSGPFAPNQSGNANSIWNAFNATINANQSTAANGCNAATGAPPATTGNLTASSTARCPFVLLSAEP